MYEPFPFSLQTWINVPYSRLENLLLWMLWTDHFPKGNARLGGAWTSIDNPGVNLFFWEFRTKLCPWEVLGRDWTQAQLKFPRNKWKNSSFSLLRKVLPFEWALGRLNLLTFLQWRWKLEILVLNIQGIDVIPWVVGSSGRVWGSCEGSACKI